MGVPYEAGGRAVPLRRRQRSPHPGVLEAQQSLLGADQEERADVDRSGGSSRLGAAVASRRVGTDWGGASWRVRPAWLEVQAFNHRRLAALVQGALRWWPRLGLGLRLGLRLRLGLWEVA